MRPGEWNKGKERERIDDRHLALRDAQRLTMRPVEKKSIEQKVGTLHSEMFNKG